MIFCHFMTMLDHSALVRCSMPQVGVEFLTGIRHAFIPLLAVSVAVPSPVASTLLLITVSLGWLLHRPQPSHSGHSQCGGGRGRPAGGAPRLDDLDFT